MILADKLTRFACRAAGGTWLRKLRQDHAIVVNNCRCFEQLVPNPVQTPHNHQTACARAGRRSP